jgi:hypothetical protein
MRSLKSKAAKQEKASKNDKNSIISIGGSRSIGTQIYNKPKIIRKKP